MSTLNDLIAALNRHHVEPISLHYEHVRRGVELTDPIRARWTLYVATCDEFRALAADLGGKRTTRSHQRGVRNLYADCGDRGLLGHVCHTGLSCWESTSEPATLQFEESA